ncbi:MAG: phage holin family protein [Candidatus Limnocylindrales bacterium]
MVGRLLVAIVINAIALFLTLQIVPGLSWPDKLDRPENLPALLTVAIIFGLVNTFLRPLVRTLALPVNLLTVWLFGFVVNAALFVLVAVIANAVGIAFKVGGFPPDFSVQTIESAFLGSIVISIVGAILSFVALRD